MKKVFVAAALCLLVVGLAARAHADLDGFLSQVNIQARADFNAFGVKLGVQFGAPAPQVRTIIAAVPTPADAFMCFQLSQMTGLPPERVAQTYRTHGGQGWGAIAKELGIKPGSAEFHALKRGDFTLTGEPQGRAPKGKGHKK